MSLINDALKRAKEAQQPRAPVDAGGPPLRPVETGPAGGLNIWLVLLFTVVVAAASILLWQWFQQSRQSPPVVAIPPVSSPTSAPTALAPIPPAVPAAPAPPVDTAPPIALAPPVEPQPTSAPAEPKTTVPPPAIGVPTPAPAVASISSMVEGRALTNAVTNATSPVAAPPAPVAEAAPKPGAPKVQGIMFHPTRPSVVIKGKLLFVGERIGEWQVTAIEQGSVTLVSSSLTNVQVLE